MTRFELLLGDVVDRAADLEPSSIDLVVSSPPYAEQRADQYGGIPETDFPAWLVEVFAAIAPALKPTASILLNIRPHLRDGELSDYMLKTRLAVRAAGWRELEELVWHKPDAPPLGSTKRPRRSWESIHWFARTTDPFVNVTANGTKTDRLGLQGGRGTRDGYISGERRGARYGIARQTDVLLASAGPAVHKAEWNDHPAQFPKEVPAWCVKLACPPGGHVLDPFVGSGTTGVAALELGRTFVGIDRDPHYLEIADRRLRLAVDAGVAETLFADDELGEVVEPLSLLDPDLEQEAG